MVLRGILLLLFTILNCGIVFSQVINYELCDKNATAETKALYSNLHKISKRGYIFGHQDDLAYGVNWRDKAGRSDVHDVVGDYPGLYGWDLAGLEKDSKVDINGIPFDKMRGYISTGYDRGGVITFSWHMNNPVNGKSSWDPADESLKQMLPGGPFHNKYKEYLDRAADYLLTLKGPDGELIPVIYRPFHELTGDWFWWCKHANSKEDFIQLWRFTVDYLKNEKGLHNHIYCYNVADFDDETGLMEYYPGDDYADIISFDQYEKDGIENDKFIEMCRNRFNIMHKVAERNNKLLALAEAGYEAIPDATWWTTVLDKVMAGSGISYVLMWRNQGLQDSNHMHYYAPYPGQVSAEDFKKLYDKKESFFESDLHHYQLYKSNPR